VAPGVGFYRIAVAAVDEMDRVDRSRIFPFSIGENRRIENKQNPHQTPVDTLFRCKSNLPPVHKLD